MLGTVMAIAVISATINAGIGAAPALAAGNWLDDCLVEIGIEQTGYYKSYVMENRCSDRYYRVTLSVTENTGRVRDGQLTVGPSSRIGYPMSAGELHVTYTEFSY